MGVHYELYNFTKRERVGSHLAAATMREHIWNPSAGAVVLWYLFQNRGDEIAMLSEDDVRKPIFGKSYTYEQLLQFIDKTAETIAHGVAAGVLEDHGFVWQDEHEPDRYFCRDIRIKGIAIKYVD
jgi:hypothetical protein